jgi:hypothetical protein
LIGDLQDIALDFRHLYYDQTRYHRHIGTDFRRTALLSGPTSQYGCCKRFLFYIYTPAEWREQVEELLVAMKALTFAQVSLMYWEMLELLRPSSYRFLRRIHMQHKEEDLLMKNAIQQEPVSVLENGMSTDHRCIWNTTDIHTYSPDASFFISTIPQRSASF